MKRRGLLDEAALGLAEAVWSDRVFAGVVLVTSTLLFRDIRWIVGASFLAGAALRGTSWKLRWSLFFAASFVLWTCTGPFSGAWSADLLTGSRLIKVVMPLRVALLLTCAGAGMRSWRLSAFGVVLAVGACLSRGEAPDWWMAGLVGVSAVVLALGACGWPRVGIAIGVTAEFGMASDLLPPSVRTVVMLLPGVVLAVWLALAGLAVRASKDLGTKTDPARLLVVCQNFAWAAISAVAAIVLFHDPTVPLMSGWTQSYGSLASLMVVSFGASLVANLGVRSRTPLGSLAAPFWLSVALMVTWSVAQQRIWPTGELGRTAVAVLWPAVLAQLLRNGSLSTRPPAVFHALLAALAVTPAVVFYLSHDRRHSDLDWVWKWEWVAFAPIAFLAVMGCKASSRRIVMSAVGVGLVSTLAVAVASAATEFRRPLPLHRDDVLASVGVWFLGGVYVVIARRAWSLSAVPIEPES